MPPLNKFYRASTAARMVLQVVERERPGILDTVINRVWAAFSGHQSEDLRRLRDEVVAKWCADLSLDCQAIRSEAFAYALAARRGTEPVEIWLADSKDQLRDPHDSNWPQYYLPWVPGESERSFIKRARAAFRREKENDRTSVGEFASADIEPSHVEWFVRYQLKGDGFGRIAKTSAAHLTTVKRSVRDVAERLEITLRPPRFGRPPGTGRSISDSPHRRLRRPKKPAARQN